MVAEIRPIRSEGDYEEALSELDRLWGSAAGTAEGDKGNRQQDSREREKGIHDHDVDEAVEASTIVAGERSDDQAYRE